MAGAGGVEVGRVSIRVVPNLDKFREDLKRGLAKETKGLKAEVDVVPNMTGFRARVAAATKGMRATVDVDAHVNRSTFANAATNGMRDFVDAVRTSVRWTRQLNPELGRTRAYMNVLDYNARLAVQRSRELANTVPMIRKWGEAWGDSARWMRQSNPDMSRSQLLFRLLSANASSAGRSVLRTGGHIKRMAQNVRNIDVPNVRDFGNAWRDSVRWMRQADPELSRTGANIRTLGHNARLARDSVRNHMTGLRDSVRDTYRTIKDSDSRSNAFARVGLLAARSASRVRDSMRRMKDSDDDDGGRGGFLSRFMRDSDRAGNAIEGTSKKFLGLTRVGWIVAAVFALAAPAIGLVGSLVAGLPSLLAGAGAAAGVLYLGWDGIKKAAEGMKEPIEKLKESLSATFEERLTPVFNKLGAALPQLEGQMQNLANGISDMFSGVADTLTSEFGMNSMNAILAGTAQLFRDITPGMQDFTAGFLAISAAGASSFGHLSLMVNNFAQQFKNSVAGVIADGSFDSAMQGMSVALGSLLSQLDRLVVAGIQVMGSMGQPMANFFQGFGDLLVGMMPSLASFSNMLFNTLGAVGTNLGSVFQTLGPSLQTVFDTLGTSFVGLVNIIGPGLNAIAIQLGPALAQIAGALGPVIADLTATLGPILVQVGSVIGTIAGQIGSVLANVITALGPSLNTIVSTVGQVATVIGGALSSALSAIGPVLPQIAASLGQVAAVMGQAFAQVVTALAPVLPVLAQAFGQIASIVADVLLQAVTALVPFLPPLAEAFAAILVAIIPLVPIIVEAAASMISALLPAVVSLMPTIVSLAQIIAAVVQAITPWIEALFRVIAVILEVAAAILGTLLSAIGSLISGFMSLVSAVTSVVSGIIALIGGFVNGIVSFFQGLISSVTSAWVGFWSGLVQTCSEWLSTAVSTVGEFPGKVLAALGNLGSVLVGAGRALMDGLLGGIKAGLQKVLDFAGGIADKIAAIKGPLPYDRKVLIRNGEALMEGLRKGMQNGFAPIEADASGMADKIADDVENGEANKKLEQSGFSFMESVKFGLKSGADNVAAYFHDALDQIGKDLEVEGLFDKVVKAITEDAKLQEIPLNFAVANADQLMSDLGFGSGAVPQLIDQLLNYDPTQDAREAEEKSKEKETDSGRGTPQIHYHVKDVQEALDMEEARRQRELLQHG
ncbi:tape measure protein [Rhodococcus phage RGL3]|uniref:Tape measure protein n=1 Tax=Rhodococcus phage RGL3 TaxID=2922221 RepID=G9FHK6_9CAUD|nr:tail length tape measure protein [Rhodococcus phage RGL3]AEV52094.1 tape measure protein [Rhodococcus phage RGL3]